MKYKIILLLSVVFILSGCGVPLRSQEMAPQFDFYDSLNVKKYKNKIYVRNAEVAKGVGGMTPVSPEEFRSALVVAFRQAGLYSKEDNARYFLDSNMTEMKQPVIGLNLTKTTTADYKLYSKSGKIVFQDTIKIPCTRTMADAFFADQRLRMANACSVGENITHLVKVLSDK